MKCGIEDMITGKNVDDGCFDFIKSSFRIQYMGDKDVSAYGEFVKGGLCIIVPKSATIFEIRGPMSVRNYATRTLDERTDHRFRLSFDDDIAVGMFKFTIDFLAEKGLMDNLDEMEGSASLELSTISPSLALMIKDIQLNKSKNVYTTDSYIMAYFETMNPSDLGPIPKFDWHYLNVFERMVKQR